MIFLKVFLFLLSFSLFAKEKIELGCNYFPPLKIGTSTKPGIDLEILELIYKDFDLNFKFMPWARALKQVTQGDIIGLCSCSKTKDRELKLLFSEKMGATAIGFFTIEKSKVFSRKSSIGVVRNYIIEDDIKEKYKLITGNTQESLIRMLEAKRIEAIYGYEYPVKYAAKKLGINLYFKKIKSNDYYFCVNKMHSNSKKLIKIFNSQINKPEIQNQVKQIKESYLIKKKK